MKRYYPPRNAERGTRNVERRVRRSPHVRSSTRLAILAASVPHSALRAPLSPARSGVTLSEILISLLVMSIGIVSLATLFPIAVLRSIQATQLTHATLLKHNAEAMLDVYPSLISNPDGNTLANNAHIREHYRTNYIVDPLGWHYMFESNPGLEGVFGNRGITPPVLFTPVRAAAPRFEGGLPDPLPPGPAKMAYRRAASQQLTVLPDSWIEQATTVAVNPTDMSVDVPPDIDLTQVPITPVTPIGPARILSRVVLTDASGRVSHIKPISSITGQTINWGLPLPSGFTSARVRIEVSDNFYSWMLSVRNKGEGRANVDLVVFFKRAYSPLDEYVYDITSTPLIDHPGLAPIVGFQKRWRVGPDGAPGIVGVDDDEDTNSDNTEDLNADGIWQRPPLPPSSPPWVVPEPDTNGDGRFNTELGFPGSDDHMNRTVRITIHPADPAPFVKKGGYVCDVQNLRWYRIQDYDEGVDGSSGLQFVDLHLDRPVVESSRPPLASGDPDLRGAVLMRGIVDVFPLGNKAP